MEAHSLPWGLHLALDEADGANDNSGGGVSVE